VAYAKNYIDSLPDNSPEKLLSKLCRMQVYGGGYWFSIQLTYEWSATINLVCRISCCFWPLTRSDKDSQMIQQWQTATRTYLDCTVYSGCWIPHRVPFALHGYAAGFSIIERVRYYHCAQYGRRTYGANMPHRQSLYHVTSWYSCCRCCPQALLS
jgi:hypothetical protein